MEQASIGRIFGPNRILDKEDEKVVPQGIRVWRGGESDYYPNATDWYVDNDSLQIYQPVNGNEEFVIAEYPNGNYARVMYDPLPVPPLPQPDEDEGDGRKDFDQ